MNICVVGTGYVGLVTGAVFADLGNDVVCVDAVPAKIEALRAGRMPIYEPGLEEMVTRNVGDGRLAFTTDLAAAVRQSDVIFIAVGTPPKATGETDLSQVETVAAEIGRALLIGPARCTWVTRNRSCARRTNPMIRGPSVDRPSRGLPCYKAARAAPEGVQAGVDRAGSSVRRRPRDVRRRRLVGRAAAGGPPGRLSTEAGQVSRTKRLARLTAELRCLGCTRGTKFP